MNRDKIVAEFAKYTSAYNPNDVKVKLKIDHTYRVATLCDTIAKSLQLSKKDRDFAWLSGMLHDIGRFEQLRRYGTFQDKVSINHAILSADLLFANEQLIHLFVDDNEIDFKMMDTVIRYHNVLKLPKELSIREKMFCDILRDADKIDILRVNCETPRTEIYDLPENAFTESYITDEVYKDIMSSRNVDRRHSKTGIDFILGHISFLYGLVFPKSVELVKKQGYIFQLLNFKSSNPDTSHKLTLINDKIRNDLAHVTWQKSIN